jgi:hypothetical protein
MKTRSITDAPNRRGGRLVDEIDGEYSGRNSLEKPKFFPTTRHKKGEKDGGETNSILLRQQLAAMMSIPGEETQEYGSGEEPLSKCGFAEVSSSVFD